MPLIRTVLASGPPQAVQSGWTIQFDASTTGAGAILRAGHAVTKFFYLEWNNDLARRWGVVTHDSKHQTFWEFLTLLLTLLKWGSQFGQQSVAILGDNTGSLTAALSLKAKGSMAAVAREIAWRRERSRWHFEVGHVPSELNTVADALSRQFEAKPAPWPTAALRGALQVEQPDCTDLWPASAEI
jgi:hypothetical protein